MNNDLLKTKYEQIIEAIEKVDYEHKVDAGMMGLLSDQEALDKYREIADIIQQVIELSVEEANDLNAMINKKIDRIYNPVHPVYNEDLITNEEEFRAAIENIHYRHRYDDGIMGTLDAGDATRLYNVLLEVLEKIPSLDEATKKVLRVEVKFKIGQVNVVEEDKIAEYHEYKAKQEVAFAEAKARFKALSFFEKIKLHRKKMTPEHQDFEFMSVEEIDNLYLRKGK